jgi:hypothetical protein
MKSCSYCNNLILDTANFCPKCGANVHNANLDSKATGESSPIGGTDSSRFIPPAPPSRSASGNVTSQQAVTGSNVNKNNYSYNSKNKFKNDSGTRRIILITIAISFAAIFGVIFVPSDSNKVDNVSQPKAEATFPSAVESAAEPSRIISQDRRKAAEEESRRLAVELAKANQAAAEAQRALLEERRRKADVLAPPKNPDSPPSPSEAQRALTEERRKAAEALAAPMVPGPVPGSNPCSRPDQPGCSPGPPPNNAPMNSANSKSKSTCPYNISNPLVVEGIGSGYVIYAWNYAVCGEPTIHKTLSKTSCTGRAKSDPNQSRIIVSDGCRAEIIPQKN